MCDCRMTHMKLYLPTNMEGHELAVEHVQQRLADRFKGFTVMEGEGGWKAGSEIVTEPVTVIESYGDVAHENAVIFMDRIAEYVAGVNLYDENAIMFTVDHSQYLVQTDDGSLRGVA